MAQFPGARSSHLGEGNARSELRPGTSTAIKDGGIDIIAWTDNNDKMPGKRYLLGQVASGNDWKDKSVISDIKLFINDCFHSPPALNPIPAMFIPFCITPNDKNHVSFTICNLSEKFGYMMYRKRIPHYFQLGIPKQPCSIKEEVLLECFIEEFCKSLQ